MCEAEGDLGGVEPGPIFRETNLIAQMEEKLTAVEEVSDKIERFG